jgi:hypothetical protein
MAAGGAEGIAVPAFVEPEYPLPATGLQTWYSRDEGIAPLEIQTQRDRHRRARGAALI